MKLLLSIIGNNYILLLLLASAFLLLLTRTYVFRRERTYFWFILILVSVFSVSSLLESSYHEGETFSYWRLVFSVIDFSVKPFIALLFYLAVTPPKKIKRFLWILPSLNAFFFLSSLVSQVVPALPVLGVYFSKDNHMVPGLFYLFCFLSSGIILILLSVEMIVRHKKSTQKQMTVVLVIVFANIMATVLETLSDNLVLFPATMTVSLIFYYTRLSFFHMGEHERKLLRQGQIDIMVSQIQPHFLYNTLNSIYHLCDQDIELAKKTIDDFSTYLRTNLRSLSDSSPIPFSDELAHTMTYLKIEKLRFGDRVRNEMKIGYSDFKIPPLTLQPLVENAVKHGICQKDEGGTVTVETKEDGDYVILTVSDDGVGFDTAVLEKGTAAHVGYQNVRQRLERLVEAELTVSSEVGKGTVITVRMRKIK